MRPLIFVLCGMMILALNSQVQAGTSKLCDNEVGRGVASWYGPGFEGALTKNHEIFDPADFSAAHPSLPFGTILKVTNLRNARSVYVRVNDRGGFAKERIIDLSEAAAQEIDMIDSGTTAVTLHQCN